MHIYFFLGRKRRGDIVLTPVDSFFRRLSGGIRIISFSSLISGSLITSMAACSLVLVLAASTLSTADDNFRFGWIFKDCCRYH